MRLVSFRVRTFRNIIDSGDIPTDAVTCLVGKNESGKSAILQALHHLNPAKPEVQLNLLDEYPRWLKKEHEISGEIDNATSIVATFEISPEEMSELESWFGAGVVKGNTVTASRSYAEDKLKLAVSIDEGTYTTAFVSKLPTRLQEKLKAVTNSVELRSELTGLAAGPDVEAEDAALASDARDALTLLVKDIGESTLVVAVLRHLEGRIPRTFYFSRYSQLKGRYPLTEVFPVLQGSQSDDEEIQAAADFLRLARIAPRTVEEWDFEASNAELEAISSLLTKRVKHHWKQNDHLRLKVSLEVQQAAAPARSVERYLQFRVEDERHDFSSRLDRRSTGFQWFVSFLASFLEFEKDKNLILLLDEPGLSLHARAQMDLLDTLETRLAEGRQVLYSTHSPFMVRTSRLNQVRIVEDQGPESGSAVLSDAGVVSDPDTLFPLQAALGYDVVQSIFIGNRNVLVEGVSDFIYLTTMSEHLSTLGRLGLPDDCRLLPAGGATNIPTFIALLGGALDVVVLIDGSTDRQRIENSVKRGRLDEARIISLDRFVNVPRADIEDLFTPSEYLVLFNGRFGTNLEESQLTGRDRIVERIARLQGPFDHGAVAAHFLRNLDTSIAGVSEETIDRFHAVIEAIRTALPPA